MRLLLRTPKSSSSDGLAQRKKAALNAAFGNFSGTRDVVKTYLGGVVEAGGAGFGAGFAGAFPAPVAAGAGTPDDTL